MKKLVQIAVSALIVLVVGGSTVRAQMTTQTVSIAPGYTNQTFYKQCFTGIPTKYMF